MLGTIVVTETYQYGGSHGKPTRRDRTVGDGSDFKGQSFFLTQSYSDLGEVASLGYPCMKDAAGGCRSADRQRTITNGYTRGVLTSVGDWADMTYQVNGLIDTIVHENNVKDTWVAEPHGIPRVRAIKATDASNQELWSTGNYEFDAAGNIRAIGSASYYYDSFRRLESWTRALSPNDHTSVGYDLFGNRLYTSYRTCRSSAAGIACERTSTAPSSIVGTTNHYADQTYDASGNVISDGWRSFSYDSLNMMTRAQVGGRDFHYLYSADDERIAVVERKNAANKTTYTVRDFANRALSMWTDDATTGSRVITWKEDTIWRGGSLLANVTPSGAKHYTLDHLGSPRLVTSASGAVLGRQEFAPFGEGGTSDGGTLQFTGHERDAAAVGDGSVELPDYMHARYYDFRLGRFLSVDPVLGEPARPQSWNRYAYVQNNPMAYVDPDSD